MLMKIIKLSDLQEQKRDYYKCPLTSIHEQEHNPHCDICEGTGFVTQGYFFTYKNGTSEYFTIEEMKNIKIIDD